MWERKELKKRAKEIVLKNYWAVIVVCFLMALLTGEFGTSIIGIWQSDDSIEPNYIRNYFLQEENIKDKLDNVQEKVFSAVEANLNSVVKPQKYLFKIWDSIESFNIQRPILGTFLSISAIIAFLFTLFIADPLIVGGKKYFLKVRQDSNAKISEVVEIFRKENWLNVAMIMFLRNIYNVLWYLTIVGGVIKTYEYRMIPYILAQNPKIGRKEAFKLSKQMMKGNKWKTFILDMSFFGWNFLSVLTFGLLSILYINPYNTATITELYVILRKKAIDEKYEYHEKLE